MDGTKLIQQLQKNGEKTVELLNELVSRKDKDIEPALKALIVQDKKNTKEMVDVLKAILKKEPIDFSEIKKAISSESKTVLSSIDDLKKKYNEKLEAIKKDGLTQKQLDTLEKKLRKEFLSSIEKELRKNEDILVILESLKDKIEKKTDSLEKKIELKTDKKESKKLEQKQKDILNEVKEFKEKVAKMIEEEVDQRYRPITTGPTPTAASSGGGVEQYINLASFPESGNDDILYIAQDTNLSYRWTGSTYQVVGDGAAASLQAVTDVGATTTNDITIDGGGLVNSALNINGSTNWAWVATSTDTFKLRDKTANADRMLVDSLGNISNGLADSNIIGKLHINHPDAYSITNISTLTSNKYASFFGYYTGSKHQGLYLGTNATGTGFIQNVDGTSPYVFSIQPFGGELVVGPPTGAPTSGLLRVSRGSGGVISHFKSWNTSDVALRLTAAPSQVGNLLEVNSSSGSGGDLARITSAGNLVVSGDLTTGSTLSSSGSTLYLNGSGAGGCRVIGHLGTSGSLGAGLDSVVSDTWLNVAAGTTTRSQIQLNPGVDPSSPNAGDLWFDGTNLKFYDGTTTHNIV